MIITTHSRTKTFGTPMNRMPLVVSIVSLTFSFFRRYPFSSTFHIDDPEYGPGAISGASGVYTSSASASFTASRTAAPKGHSSNGGAIAGGVVGGLAIVSIIAAAVIFHRRRRSRASDRSAIFDEFRPHMGEISWPMSDGGTVSPSSMAPSIAIPYTQDVLNDQTTS